MTAPSQSASITLADGRQAQVLAVASDAIRLRISRRATAPSALVRYGVVEETLAGTPAPTVEHGGGRLALRLPGAALELGADGCWTFRDGSGRVLLACHQAAEMPVDGGWSLPITIDPAETIQGLGDVARDRLHKRGFKTAIWVRNVASYVPVPFLMGSTGWGLFIDSTWRMAVDAGSERADLLRIGVRGGDIDVVLFAGGGFRANLDRFTALSGRPALLPLWAYGLTFVCNEQADARELLSDCLNMRREGIPCDLIGLEPGWMSQHYDYSVDKKWHPDRFRIPGWLSGKSPASFVGAMDRLGFKLSLWLCCDYDLTWEAERRAGVATSAKPSQPAGFHPDDFEQDQHFGHGPCRLDKITKPQEPWLEHLKKFVDQGAVAFKLDGALQVNEHPDRLYGNGMSDEEAHNLYPIIYNQQMHDGYVAHTKRRAMIYSSGGYTGIQRFSATWAGDTGGGPKPLASMLNHAFVGHSNVSCDMDVFTVQGIHFGFLQSWAQVNSWAYWRHPWLLGETLKPVFVAYAKLRYRLLPYLYAAAHEAAASGWPMMRPMSLVHPDAPAAAERLTQYYLGGDLIAGAFAERIWLPEGHWYDRWSGAPVEGGREVVPQLPADRGGALFVRAGAVIPCWPPMDHVGQRPLDHVILEVWPGGDGTATIHEDDGESHAWRDGQQALTRVALTHRDGRHRLEIGARTGSFPGMPAVRRLTLHLRGATRPGLTVDGRTVDLRAADGAWEVDLSDGPHTIEF
jgi:alpha-glucosidase